MKKSIFGLLLMLEGAFVLLAFLMALYCHVVYQEEDWKALGITAAVCFAIGGFSKLLSRKDTSRHLTRADSFLIVALSWVVFSAVGMLPYILYLHLDPASAFFEAMSGFTTTGATVLSGLDDMPHGILFWRSLTQWMGGLGIVVFSFALIPVYDLKNSNIFSAEVTGIGLDRLRPKIGSTARRLLVIYVFLTGACALAYWLGSMSLFDSVCHALTTIATGGFSTHDKSMAHFGSPFIEYAASFFMVLASINFSLFYYMSIRRPKVLWKNEELRGFLGIWSCALLCFVLLFSFAPTPLSAAGSLPPAGEETFRASLFHVSTIMSSTGFAGPYCDFVAWGNAFWTPTLLIMAIGACAGSTGGGIKVIRILICIKSVVKEFVLQLHPRTVISIRISGQVVSDDRVRRVLVFIFIYLMLILVGIAIFTSFGLDVDTSLGDCVTMLSNVGPGTGSCGPTANFAHVHDVSKWVMSFYMLVGRLEIFTVLFLFMPSFWRDRT